MRSSKLYWSKSVRVFVAIAILCCEGFQLSRASTECTKHISADGINREDVSSEGDSVTFRYYVKKDDLLKPKDDLYTLHWGEDIMPLNITQDLRFSKYFEVNEKNQSLRVSVKKASLVKRNFSRVLRAVESRRIFGQFTESANCTVILRHYFTCLSARSKSTKGNFVVKGTTAVRTYNAASSHHPIYMTTTKNPKVYSTSTLESYINSDDLSTTSIHYPEIDYISRRPQSSIHSSYDVLPDVGRYALVDVTTAFVTTTDSNNEESNLKLTVGIIGGFLALMFFIGIGVGIYYNYKKGVRLGLFRRRPKENKTISTLGSFYPNIGCSDPDMREKEQGPEDQSSSCPPYPNYAYANPAATEPVPTNHRLI